MAEFRDKFAIVGLGMVTGDGGRALSGVSPIAMAAEAARLAIVDAGLKRQDIDGSIGGVGERGDTGRPPDQFPRVLGLPVKFHMRQGEEGAGGIMSATQALELGIAKYVVIASATNGWSVGHRTEFKEEGHRGTKKLPRAHGDWGAPFGDLRAASHHSFFASRHMTVYGTTPRQFGALAVAVRQWASMNPLARYYRRRMTIEDYMDSPFLVYPYHLFDISLVSDGGVAFIVTTAERAKDCAKPPVYIMGIGFGEAGGRLWWEKPNHNYLALAVDTAKEQAFSQAGIELKDIDVAHLYDCFTGELLFQLEDYGWCKKGEGGAFAEEGHIGPGGDHPTNTSGGLLSAYHYGGMTGISEIIIQLRGEGGERQVKDAEVGLASSHGGEMVTFGMCSMHRTVILRR